ncbi:uncharacterized protein LOC144744396 [Ciona intestinalis]
MFKGLLSGELSVSSDSETEEETSINSKAELIKSVVNNTSNTSDENKECNIERKRKLVDQEVVAFQSSEPTKSSKPWSGAKVPKTVYKQTDKRQKVTDFLNVNDHLHTSCCNWYSKKDWN